ncbi:MAG: hypothetical protein U0X20_25060 [Caldilineaceae bacterium]
MSFRWWQATSVLLVLSLFISSCGPSIFKLAEAGVQQAANDALPKPPLAITKGSSDPIPAINAEDYKLPKPPVRPFCQRRPFPRDCHERSPDALLVGAAPAVAPTPLPAPTGPSFEWSKTDNYLVLGTDHRPGWTSAGRMS